MTEPAPDILDGLGPVLTRWTMGGAAAGVAPADWRAELGNDPAEAELRLLALSGHLLGTLTLAQPSGPVEPRPPLPRLARPPLPEALRPIARRLLARSPGQSGGQSGGRSSLGDLLDFLDARGWTLHPGDWLPGSREDVPEVYAAWQDWMQNAAESGEPASPPTAETVENWDLLGAAGRRTVFAALRRRDAAAASLFLTERIAAENADMRVRLLEILAADLSPADLPLLDSLQGDRAPRVRALVGALSARLGHGQVASDDAGDLSELAGFFAVQSKGLLRRTRVVVPQPLKTPAQRGRRTALMAAAGFDAFAAALGLSAADLVSGWPWFADPAADHALAGMAARSAADAVVVALADALSGRTIDLHGLGLLLPRLSPVWRRAAALRLLQADGGGFALALRVGGAAAGIDDAVLTRAGTTLLAALRGSDADIAGQADELLALGLVASRMAARQAIERIVAAGPIASDPRLDMLRLNAALPDPGLENTGATE